MYLFLEMKGREAHEAPIYSNATTKKRIISKSEKDRRETFLLLTFDLQHQKRQKIFVLTFLVIFNGYKETVDFLYKMDYFHVHIAGNRIDQRSLLFFFRLSFRMIMSL